MVAYWHEALFNYNTLQMEHFLARKAAKDSALSNDNRIPWDSSKEPLIATFISLWLIIDQFRYNKIQPKTIDLSTRLWGINTEFVGFIPQSLVPRSIVLGWILIYRILSIDCEGLGKLGNPSVAAPLSL